VTSDKEVRINVILGAGSALLVHSLVITCNIKRT
jgi:hypothetical protein